MIFQLTGCIILGSVLWLDRVYMFQLMVSRPVVIAPLLGFIMGNTALGLLVGGSLELLWLTAPPLGGFLPYDDTFAAIVSVLVGSIARIYMDTHAACGLAIVLGIPTAITGRWIDNKIRTANNSLVLDNETGGLKNRINGIMLLALSRAFLYVLAGISICTAVLGTMVYLYARFIPDSVTGVLSFMPFLAVVLGVATFFAQIKSRSITGWTLSFISGLAIVWVVSWLVL